MAPDKESERLAPSNAVFSGLLRHVSSLSNSRTSKILTSFKLRLLLNTFMNVELEKSVTGSNPLTSGKKAERIPAGETGI